MSVVTNFAPNPSSETGTAGHTAVPGTTGVAAITNPTVTTAFGTKVTRCTWSTASTAVGGGEYFEIDIAAVGLAVGDVVSAGWFHLLSSIGQRVQMSVEFRTGAATISTFNGTAKQLTAATVYGAATDAECKLENLTIPATCTKIRIRVLTVTGTGYANWSIGSYLQLDGLMLVKGATLPLSYIDGAQGNLYAWSGTAHASTSALYTPVITATPHAADVSLPPRITVLATDLPPTAVRVSVLQITTEDGTVIVRDALKAAASGSFVVTDYEPPTGILTVYRVEMFNVSGASLGLTASASAQVDIPLGWVVVQDPLAPKNWALVRAEARFADSLEYGRSVNLVRRGLDTIALMGESGLLENVSLRLVSLSAADRASVGEVLAQGTALVRTQSPMPLPRCLHVSLPKSRRVPVNARLGGSADVWDIVGNQISRTPIGVIEAVVTYAQFKAVYATYAAAKAVYATYLDAKLNPPPGV